MYLNYFWRFLIFVCSVIQSATCQIMSPKTKLYFSIFPPMLLVYKWIIRTMQKILHTQIHQQGNVFSIENIPKILKCLQMWNQIWMNYQICILDPKALKPPLLLEDFDGKIFKWLKPWIQVTPMIYVTKKCIDFSIIPWHRPCRKNQTRNPLPLLNRYIM